MRRISNRFELKLGGLAGTLLFGARSVNTERIVGWIFPFVVFVVAFIVVVVIAVLSAGEGSKQTGNFVPIGLIQSSSFRFRMLNQLFLGHGHFLFSLIRHMRRHRCYCRRFPFLRLLLFAAGHIRGEKRVPVLQ